MNGGAEKPTAVSTSGNGTANVTVDGNSLEVSGSFQGLSSNATAAHIHGPADVNSTANPFCTLTVPASTSGTITAGEGAGSCGDIVLTDDQVQAFEDGLMYVNIHTTNHPAGEIRGQLLKRE